MNPIYRVAVTQAKKLLTNPAKTQEVLSKVMQKTDEVSGKQSLIADFKDNIILFFGLIADFITGKYRRINFSTAAKILGALIYFLFIVDVVPDFLTVIGLTDDAAVLAWVINSVSGDIEDYKRWKQEQHQKKLPLNTENRVNELE